jgi:hypothetical protein
MSRFDKFAVALVAASVCGYVAWTHIDCALDPHCHVNWCHRRVCGISYDAEASEQAKHKQMPSFWPDRA